jgi:hypothetical protein
MTVNIDLALCNPTVQIIPPQQANMYFGKREGRKGDFYVGKVLSWGDFRACGSEEGVGIWQDGALSLQMQKHSWMLS